MRGGPGRESYIPQPRRLTPSQVHCPGAHGDIAPHPTPQVAPPGTCMFQPFAHILGGHLPFLWVV